MPLDFDENSYNSVNDPDVNPALGGGGGVYATAPDGSVYETIGQPENALYDPSMWLNDAGITIEQVNPSAPDYARPDGVLSASEELAAYERHFEQMQRQGINKLDGEIIGTNLSHMQTLFGAPQFQEYLDSDDDSYEQIQINPQLLAAIERTWDIDAATAKSFAKFHNISAQQLQVLAGTLGVDLGGEALMEYSTQPSNTSKKSTKQANVWDSPRDYDDDDGDEYEPESQPQQQPVEVQAEQDLASIRKNHFPIATNAEWAQVQNQVLDAFEKLSPQQQAQFDDAEGFVRLYNMTKGMRKAETQHQQQKQAVAKHRSKGVAANALTPDGRLRGSYIKGLSDKAYAANAAKLDGWIASGRIAWNQ